MAAPVKYPTLASDLLEAIITSPAPQTSTELAKAVDPNGSDGFIKTAMVRVTEEYLSAVGKWAYVRRTRSGAEAYRYWFDDTQEPRQPLAAHRKMWGSTTWREKLATYLQHNPGRRFTAEQFAKAMHYPGQRKSCRDQLRFYSADETMPIAFDARLNKFVSTFVPEPDPVTETVVEAIREEREREPVLGPPPAPAEPVNPLVEFFRKFSPLAEPDSLCDDDARLVEEEQPDPVYTFVGRTRSGIPMLREESSGIIGRFEVL